MKEKNIKEVKQKTNLLLVAISASAFGLLSGLAGLLIGQNYFFDIFSSWMPNTGSVNYQSNTDSKQINSLIESAKRIINEKSNENKETAVLALNSLVGIFEKKQNIALEKNSKENFDLSDYYYLNENIGQGLIITSDGWILVPNNPSSPIEKEKISQFLAISKNKNIYEIDDYKETGIDSYVFLHLAEADNLPVKSFFFASKLDVGQTLIAVDWSGNSFPVSVLKKDHADEIVKNSDSSEENITLSTDLSDYFKDAFIFDLENRVVGGFTEKNDFISIDDMQRLILGLLQDKEIKRPSLGVTYSNLSEFAIKDTAYEKGALLVSSDKKPAVKPGSAAELAGLKEGDIILSVNNATLNADWDLADLLKKYSAGEEIDILYSRAGEEKIAKVILGELK